jgi:branched-chain amino acid transport system permease protein
LLTQQLLNGLVLGVGYSLMALGYSMIFGVLRVINFAHGSIYIFGGYVGLTIVRLMGGGFFLCILAGMISSALIGLIMERLVFRPVRHMPPIAGLLTSTGAMFSLNILAMIIWGPNPQSYSVNAPSYFWNLGDLSISYLQLVMLIAAVIVMVVLWLLVDKTSMGLAMRASSHSTITAQLMGIDVNKVTKFTLAVSSALAGLAGVLVASYYGVIAPTFGFNASIKAFTSAIIGGIGSIPGSLIGGIMLCLIEGLTSAYISSAYRDAISFTILILVLLAKPTGLLGKSSGHKM